jgi:hypothetical protein
MVWPMFLDESGNELSKGQPVMQKGKANMYIINDELRKTVHRERIREGVCFHLVEGRKVVADGTVTRILGLFED